MDLLQEKEREVERNMVENYMKTIHAKGYYETSAKTGDNIDTLFDTIATNAFAKFKEGIFLYLKSYPPFLVNT